MRPWTKAAACLALAVSGCDGTRTRAAEQPLEALVPGPEHATDAPVWGRAEQPQYFAAIAPAADASLVVWYDQRREPGGDIAAARVGPDCEVLDVPARLVAYGEATQENPRVASDGTGWLVVWTDWRNAALAIYGCRIDATGVPLDAPDGFPIAVGAEHRLTPDVAFDGTNYVVVWEDLRGADADVYAARVTPAGDVLDPDGVPFAAAPGAQAAPRIVRGDGTKSLVVWSDGGDRSTLPAIRTGRIGADALPIDGAGVVVTTEASGEPATAAFGAGVYAVFWQAAAGEGDVVASRLDVDLDLLDATPILVSGGTGEQGGPTAGFDGTDFLVAWHHQTSATDFDIRARRVDPSGQLLGAGDVVLAGEAKQEARPALATFGAAALVAYDDLTPAQDMDIFALAWPPGDATGAPALVSGAANAQHTAALGDTGASGLLVWTDARAAVTQTLALPLDPAGVPAVSEAVNLGGKVGAINAVPALSSDDASFVAWMRFSDVGMRYWDIVGTRIGDGAEPLDPKGVAVSEAPGMQTDVAMASDGETRLVVYAEQPPVGDGQDIRGVRIASDATVLDPDGIAIGSSPEWYENDPAIAFGADRYLVAWERIPDGTQPEHAHIQYAIVGPDGTAGAPQTLGSPDPGRDAVGPAIAFDGTNFLIVWEMHLPEGWNVWGTRVTPDGKSLDPKGFQISHTLYADTGRLLIHPSVIFDGTSYLAAWQDEFLTRIELTRVGVDGTVLDAEPLVLDDLLGVTRPRLGRYAGGRPAIAYERFVLELGGWRVVHRALGPEPDAGTAGAGGSTASSGSGGGGEPSAGAPPRLAPTGGCGCRTAPADDPQALWLAALVPAALTRRRVSRR